MAAGGDMSTPRWDVPNLLERIDRCLRELEAIKAAVTASMPTPAANGAGSDADDFADGSLLDTSSASIRFNYPRDTIALWCRQGDGKKVGGRWMVSIPRLQKRINGG
jgi:hypothetical protein